MKCIMAQTEDFQIKTKLGGTVTVPSGESDATLATREQAEDGWWSEWVCDPAEVDGVAVTIEHQPAATGYWVPVTPDTGLPMGDENSTSLSWGADQWGGGVPLTATRRKFCGPVPTKPEDIGAQPALTSGQLANIAAVPTKANDSSVVHNTGDESVSGIKTFSNGLTVGTRRSGAAVGERSTAEGNNVEASAPNSHGEGSTTNAWANNSHAEGYATTASGLSAHAEGYGSVAGSTGFVQVSTNTSASQYTHAEGNGTHASGNSSHTEGKGTVATGMAEHAEGRYNASNAVSGAHTIHSVGIGDSTTRRNAFEILDNGKVYVYGIGGYDGTNPSTATDLATFVGNLQATLSMAANGGIGGADGHRYVLAVDAGGHICVVRLDEEDNRNTPNLTKIQFAAVPEDATDSTDSTDSAN